MEDIDIGDWKFLSKVDEYSFSDYLSRLNKWEAIKVTKTNIENNAEFKIKSRTSKYDEVTDAEGNTHRPRVPALKGKLEIRQEEENIMLKYDLWIDKKSWISNFIFSMMLGFAIGTFAYVFLIMQGDDPVVGLLISIFLASIFILKAIFSWSIVIR